MSTALHDEQYAGEYSRAVAEEVRATLGRKGISMRGLARALQETPSWVSRRLGAHSARTKDITVDDLYRIAAALGVSPRELMPLWLPRLDSNQQPFGYPGRALRVIEGGRVGRPVPPFGNDTNVIPFPAPSTLKPVAK